MGVSSAGEAQAVTRVSWAERDLPAADVDGLVGPRGEAADGVGEMIEVEGRR
jgi:hypothetical protein